MLEIFYFRLTRENFWNFTPWHGPHASHVNCPLSAAGTASSSTSAHSGCWTGAGDEGVDGLRPETDVEVDAVLALVGDAVHGTVA